MENKTIITISRQFGSGGREIGKKIADQLGIPFYDKELIEIAAKESGMDKELFEEDDARTSRVRTPWCLGIFSGRTIVHDNGIIIK